MGLEVVAYIAKKNVVVSPDDFEFLNDNLPVIWWSGGSGALASAIYGRFRQDIMELTLKDIEYISDELKDSIAGDNKFIEIYSRVGDTSNDFHDKFEAYRSVSEYQEMIAEKNDALGILKYWKFMIDNDNKIIISFSY